MCQLFLDEESIYEFLKLYLNKFWTDTRTDARTDKMKAICTFNFSNVVGIKKSSGIPSECQHFIGPDLDLFVKHQLFLPVHPLISYGFIAITQSCCIFQNFKSWKQALWTLLKGRSPMWVHNHFLYRGYHLRESNNSCYIFCTGSSQCWSLLRPNKKICVFRVMGRKILGSVGTHFFFKLYFLWKKI